MASAENAWSCTWRLRLVGWRMTISVILKIFVAHTSVGTGWTADGLHRFQAQTKPRNAARDEGSQRQSLFQQRMLTRASLAGDHRAIACDNRVTLTQIIACSTDL